MPASRGATTTTTSPSRPRSHPDGPGSSNIAGRSHICSYCSKAFSTSGHLSRHVRVHTGEMNFVCSFPGCTTRCSRKDNLRQHYRLHFDIRDPEELRRIAPYKKRRRTRVQRVATVDATNTMHMPLTTTTGTPTPTFNPASPSSSGSPGSSRSASSLSSPDVRPPKYESGSFSPPSTTMTPIPLKLEDDGADVLQYHSQSQPRLRYPEHGRERPLSMVSLGLELHDMSTSTPTPTPTPTPGYNARPFAIASPSSASPASASSSSSALYFSSPTSNSSASPASASSLGSSLHYHYPSHSHSHSTQYSTGSGYYYPNDSNNFPAYDTGGQHAQTWHTGVEQRWEAVSSSYSPSFRNPDHDPQLRARSASLAGASTGTSYSPPSPSSGFIHTPRPSRSGSSPAPPPQASMLHRPLHSTSLSQYDHSRAVAFRRGSLPTGTGSGDGSGSSIAQALSSSGSSRYQHQPGTRPY